MPVLFPQFSSKTVKLVGTSSFKSKQQQQYFLFTMTRIGCSSAGAWVSIYNLISISIILTIGASAAWFAVTWTIRVRPILNIRKKSSKHTSLSRVKLSIADFGRLICVDIFLLIRRLEGIVILWVNVIHEIPLYTIVIVFPTIHGNDRIRALVVILTHLSICLLLLFA